MVAAHPVVVLEMADHGLNGGATPDLGWLWWPGGPDLRSRPWTDRDSCGRDSPLAGFSQDPMAFLPYAGLLAVGFIAQSITRGVRAPPVLPHVGFALDRRWVRDERSDRAKSEAGDRHPAAEMGKQVRAGEHLDIN
jgi:hypothetical protein